MGSIQPGILGAVPRLARYVTLRLRYRADAGAGLAALRNAVDGDLTVVGVGESLTRAVGAVIPGLRTFPHFTGPGFEVPSTPAALWCWLRGDDRGELLHRTRSLKKALSSVFVVEQVIDAFQYLDSRDLTGFEDGTENPRGKKAAQIATLSGHSEALDGSSFVAVQQWVHDLDVFEAMTTADQDNAIGRRRSDNEELTDAPASAHIKRTAQESFEPEAFVVRRSMPWADGKQAGLEFVAFGNSLDAFEAQLRRMVGAEDGITDALFTFSRPVSGAYFWCPPTKDGVLDLSAIGL